MPHDDLEMLDFEPTLQCEVPGQPYLHAKPAYTAAGLSMVPDPFPDVPAKGDCGNPAAVIVTERVCPCYLNDDIWRRSGRTDEPAKVADLFVTRHLMCEAHVRYWRDYVRWPLQCGRCGTSFLHPGEKFVEHEHIENGNA